MAVPTLLFACSDDTPSDDGPMGVVAPPCVPEGPELEDSGAVQLASGAAVLALTTGPRGLFWVDGDGSLWQLAPEETAPRRRLQDVQATDLLQVDGFLYYIGPPRALFRIDLDATTPAPQLLLDRVAPGLLKADGENVYVSLSGDPFGLFALPQHATAEALVPILPDETPGTADFRAGTVTYSDFTTVRRAPIERAATGTAVLTIGGLNDVATDASENVLVAAEGSILTVPRGDEASPRPIVVASERDPSADPVTLGRLRVRGDVVLYRESDGGLAWSATDGSRCGILARVPTRAITDTLRFAADDERAYFLEGGQTLWAVPYR